MRMLTYPFNQDDLIEIWFRWYNGTVRGFHDLDRYDNNNYDEEKSKVKHKNFPLAAMIAKKYSELLFNEPVEVNFVDEATQARFDEIRSTANFDNSFSEGSKMQSALGDLVIKLNLDRMEEAPTISYYTPDLYDINDYKWGKIRNIVFYSYLKKDKKYEYYIREEHELDLNEDDEKVWRIYQTLVRKDMKTKDMVEIPVDSMKETANLTPVIESDKRMFWHLPVNRPNTLSDSEKGISDYHNSIDTFIEIDQAFTSLFNDIIQGKAKMMMSPDMLQVDYDDNGKPIYSKDIDKTFYILAEELENPEQIQFTIRFSEHLDGIDKLIMQAISQAGLSPSSFGYDSTGLKTATEIKSLQGASYSTKLNRQLSWKPVLTDLFEQFIEWDNVKNGTNNNPEVESVEFQDALANDEESVRESVGKAVTQRVMSVFQAVKRQHPDWEDDAILEEVARIQGVTVDPEME